MILCRRIAIPYVLRVLQILFITANRLGDAVLSTGLLAALLACYPGAAVTIACGPLPAPLFAAMPNATIITLAKAPYAGHWRQLWCKTIGTHWDLIVDLRESVVSRLLRAKRRLIWHKNSARLHKVEELAVLLGINPAPAPRLWLSPAAIAAAKALLPAGPILALAPGANSIGKRWPVERFMRLAKILTAADGFLPGATILMLGDSNDRALISPYLTELSSSATAGDPGRAGVLSPPGWSAFADHDTEGKIINLTGQLPLDLTAACLSLSTFYIGNDSGLTHLAAAANTPTLALFGPGIAWKYRPWGDHAAYVSKADDPARDYDLCKDADDAAALALMQRLSIEDVLAAAAGLWQKVQP
jgi:heptosyltransferase-3